MINLLFHSHTVVPAHLAELEGLGVLDPDEQVLVAVDGVLLDAQGRRLSGPTLHDYCLITSLRVILWARDYGSHLCYAFPLTELALIEGAGLDPLHAQIQLAFVAAGEEEQHFTLTLLPLVHLQAALALLRCAADSARQLQAAGVGAREAGGEIMAVLSEQIYGSAEGLRPGESPYRWPGAGGAAAQPLTPGPAYSHEPQSLPPGQVYAAGRLARSAWDTLRRTLREAELPFDLSSGSLRELTEAVRAVNDLVQTVATNPSAQQLAMAFINRQAGGAQAAGQEAGARRQEAGAPPAAPVAEPLRHAAPEPPPAAPTYHEIPLRRRGAPAAPEQAAPAAASQAPAPAEPPAPAASVPDRREIPLRRRPAAPPHLGRAPIPAPVSGSGDRPLGRDHGSDGQE